MKLLIVSIFLVLSYTSAHSSVLIEEKGQKVSRSYVKIADNGLQFRDLRKVGVGMGFSGVHGLMGVDLHLNFTPTVTFTGGYGFSRGFNEYHLQLKKVIAGNSFLPYVAGGYAQWYSKSGKKVTESSPSFLKNSFLSQKERETGNFSESIIYPAIGVEYVQLNGEYAGMGFYFELLMLIDVDDFVSETSGGFGMNYYF